MSVPVPPSFLQRAYVEDDRKLRVLYLKVSCLLVALLTASGVGLDSFMYRTKLTYFLEIRAACILIALLLFAACFFKGIERFIRPMGLIWALVTQSSICAMVYFSGEAGSPYYAGL